MKKNKHSRSVFLCVSSYVIGLLLGVALIGVTVAIINNTPAEHDVSSSNGAISFQIMSQAENVYLSEASSEGEESEVSNISKEEVSSASSSTSDNSSGSLSGVSDVSSSQSDASIYEESTDESHDETRVPLESSASNSTASNTTSTEMLYTADEFKVIGVIRWNGWRWTWYTERILPGEGLKIPGRHNDADGYVCDENDYICLASSTLKKGTVIDTPFGKKGKVYDAGCAKDVIDVYVNW